MSSDVAVVEANAVANVVVALVSLLDLQLISIVWLAVGEF
jgi:hypothetical protein